MENIMFATRNIVLIAFIILFIPISAYSEDDKLKQLGIDKTTIDTINKQTNSYIKNFYETNNGTKIGAYGSSTKEYKNPGERDTTANEKIGGGSVGVGVTISK
jgi:hypothetical protein